MARWWSEYLQWLLATRDGKYRWQFEVASGAARWRYLWRKKVLCTGLIAALAMLDGSTAGAKRRVLNSTANDSVLPNTSVHASFCNGEVSDGKPALPFDFPGRELSSATTVISSILGSIILERLP